MNDRDVERLLSGRPAEDAESEELAALLSDLRAVYAGAPPAATEAAHLTAIAAAARTSAAEHEQLIPVPGSLSPARRRPRRRRKMTRKRLALLTVGLVLGASLAIVGLATAGITLPDAAQAPFDEIGVELPNQASADDVRTVIDESTQPAARRCAFGQDVARAANGGRAGPSEYPCAHQDNLGGGQAQSGAAASQAGASNAQNDNVHAQLGRSFGQGTAADAQENASDEGRAFGERTSHPQDLGDQQSQAGQQLGQSHAQAGQQHAQSGQQIAEEHRLAGQHGPSQAPGGGAP
jgi:hypothetical protein